VYNCGYGIDYAQWRYYVYNRQCDDYIGHRGYHFIFFGSDHRACGMPAISEERGDSVGNERCIYNSADDVVMDDRSCGHRPGNIDSVYVELRLYIVTMTAEG
jgi:hypothetical protein